MDRISRMSLDYEIQMAGTDTESPEVGIHGHAFVGVIFDGNVPAAVTFLVAGRDGDFKTLSEGGSDVTLAPIADKAIPLPASLAGWQRFKMAFTAIGSAATWRVVGKG